ncbi:hypothetical protein QAD02_006932 [Eretmocerus hayati]|uniref:Uncharacterized protein n=1 Tax=Eretmocerus hayati TaxID=131215 RepID=A0ACC2N280_9HYME|nr:hypothetical protein QAD02_006932 [Eretmocerus hayati]
MRKLPEISDHSHAPKKEEVSASPVVSVVMRQNAEHPEAPPAQIMRMHLATTYTLSNAKIENRGHDPSAEISLFLNVKVIHSWSTIQKVALRSTFDTYPSKSYSAECEVIDSVNQLILNPKGLKIVRRSDCPEVEPQILRTVPGLPLLLDIFQRKPLNTAIKDAFVRTKNAFLKSSGFMIISIDQCQGDKKPFEGSENEVLDDFYTLLKHDPVLKMFN